MGDHNTGRGKGRGKRGGKGAGGGSKNEKKTTNVPSDGFWAVSCSDGGGGGRSQPKVDKVAKVATPTVAKKEEKSNPGERKFAEACMKIQESVDRYLERHDLAEDADEDEDEDDLEEGAIIDRVYQSYGDQGTDGRTQQYLQEAVKSGTLVCLVCIDGIKRLDPVWNCGECFSSFHIQCVQKWAKDSIFQLSEAQADNAYDMRALQSTLSWCCPKCRSQYSQRAIPTRYLCFCGKKIDPEFDPWLPPHSCGEVCGRKLQPLCGHSCLLLCHPGPCPPCPKNVSNSCHCGQQPAKTRRCSNKAWTCGQPCGRILSCGQHPCRNPCHPEECSPCPRKSQQHCSCGGSKQLRECARPVWHCDKVCNKQHSCGYHRCQQICHKEDCGLCPSSGRRSCPCGKTSHTLPCTQDIPSCGDTCGKELACGVHLCAERCHKGACPMCLQFRVKRCRCGAREKEMACSKELVCELKCKKLRDCGRHTCSRKSSAVLGSVLGVSSQCGRTLGCRTHKCGSRCHQGPCYPCSVTYTLACRCGKTSISVPCGVTRPHGLPGAPNPAVCVEMRKNGSQDVVCCRQPPECHHPERKKHKCHQGDCPRCRMVCGLQLSCDHQCPHSCHHAVPVVDKKKRAGPWEPVAVPRIEIQKQPCPPCQVPVPTICFGRHETPDWPCSDVRPYSCGRKCGRALACTNHTCRRECHTVEGAHDSLKAGANCAPCQAFCSKVRAEGCTHECGKPCHPKGCAPCKLLVKIKCHCTLTFLYLPCHSFTTGTPDQKEAMRSCKNQCNKLVSCGHRCSKECHSGPCSEARDCHKRVTVRCACKRQRKEYPCPSLSGGKVKLECDGICAIKLEEKRKTQEEEEKKKQEEEQAKQRKEVEEFERKLEGRKHRRRNRHNLEPEVEPSLWQRQRGLLLGTAVVAVTVAFSVYLVTSQV
ncbi:NF-X1-type zinc finger protein NFXL1 [Chionoecetes opilio]|uniref:NF-X1-type zinc finger protein NFXL1 n=1 Tax=Chionoecetes opilio TaxID=41210 RepID=A0A8J4YBS2_CHIOP|nr:NF-X1-type zinc finger protein NFXL1 [Chionoecetes opilio]